MPNKKIANAIREVVFGLEDGMVSTMGVITGIASGTQDRFTIILAGLVIVSVESLAMAAGTYLSNKTEEEYFANTAKLSLHQRLHRQAMTAAKSDALYMGIAYVVGGSIPLLPYFFMPLNLGVPLSIVTTVMGLAVVGWGKAKITGTKPFKSALEMIIVSLTAAAVGYGIGKAVSIVFPQLKNVSI